LTSPTTTERYLAGGIYWVFRGLGKLPLSWLHGLGTIVGWLGWLLPGSYKERARHNIRLAYPNADKRMDRLAMIELMKMFLELPFLWSSYHGSKVDQLVHCDDWSLIDTTLKQGAGLILISPHVGAFEMLGPVVSRRYKATVIFKEPKMRWLGLLIARVRLTANLTMVPAERSGVKSLVTALRRGEVIGLLPDQVPAFGEGVYAPFFGEEAYTMTLLQRLQEVRGSPIWVVGLERLAQSRGYRLHVAPLQEPLPVVPVQAASAINMALEGMIQRMPTQYLWGYNRYKAPKQRA
jgi:Kdo2-lipid IVA lauroyltransferase/acyltransferase